MRRILISGGSGFIGHHLARFLRSKGDYVRVVDVEEPKFSSISEFDEFLKADLRYPSNAEMACEGIDQVYNLAAMNGSIELTTTNKADLVDNNTRINLNMAMAVVKKKVKRVYFSSSACVYPINLQDSEKIIPLREEDAYPANPDSEYGWEKLYAERLWKSYEEDKGIQVRIGRYFNIYGPESLIDTLRSKAPMALTRKVIEATGENKIEVWGDGNQKRSFLYVDDCVRATFKLMNSEIKEPLNIGSEDLMSINELVDIISSIENKKVIKNYNTNRVQGVRTRHSDLVKTRKLLNWQREVSPLDGLTKLNHFVHGVVDERN